MTTSTVFPRPWSDEEPVSEKSRRKTDDLKRAAVMPVVTSSESVQPPPEVERQRDSNRFQVSYEQQCVLASVENISLATSTAWMEGEVIFEERPLSEMVREIWRYHAEEIRILDSQVEALKVSGVFGVNDCEGFLKTLERAIPVKFSQVNRELIVLERTNDLSERR